MRLAVGGVVELVCPDGVVERLGVAFGLVVVVVWVLEGDGGDGADVGSQQAQQVDLALRLCVGHVDDQVVALGAADVGETDAGVASGAFNDGSAGLEETALLCVLHNVYGGAVLDRATGVEEFAFGVDVALDSEGFGDAVQAHERGVADVLEDAVHDGGRQARGGRCDVRHDCGVVCIVRRV